MAIQIKDVFIITDDNKKRKATWSKIGIAFVNKDNSLNVHLDAVPMKGTIHIRDQIKKHIPQGEKNDC